MKLSLIDEKLDALAVFYTAKPDQFLFTEKEIHSQFYALCIADPEMEVRGYRLIHTEYPTPFKCSISDSKFQIEEPQSSHTRSHIDCVFLNSAFIEWICKTETGIEYVNGLPQSGLFHKFSDRMNEKYRAFFSETGESVLEYAIEFKYIRHSYLGKKHPLLGIKQDLSKMESLKEYGVNSLGSPHAFVKKTCCVIVLGELGNYIRPEIEKTLPTVSPGEYRIIGRE